MSVLHKPHDMGSPNILERERMKWKSNPSLLFLWDWYKMTLQEHVGLLTEDAVKTDDLQIAK